MKESPRIVALAGTLCSPAIFDPLAERLHGSAEIQPISWMTLPGPWDVPAVAQKVATAIEPSNGTPVVLIGHSTGGAIALQVALDYPHLISSLVLIDTGPNMLGHGDVDAIIHTMKTSWGPELFASVLDRSFAGPLDADVRERFLRYASTVSPDAAIEVLTSQRAIDFTPRLADLNYPTAVIHGTKDPTRTIDQARSFASAIPRATLHLLTSGHSPMFELPGETAEIIESLL